MKKFLAALLVGSAIFGGRIRIVSPDGCSTVFTLREGVKVNIEPVRDGGTRLTVVDDAGKYVTCFAPKTVVRCEGV